MLATVEGPEVRVVGEAASPTESGLAPTLSEADVVLVADEELLEEAALAADGTQALLLLSGEDGSAAKLRALPLRGWGIVLPDAPLEEIEAAIAAVAQDLVVLPKPLAEQLLQEESAAVEELSEPLSAREREVLALLGRGLSNKLIARELHISEHTVKFHVSALLGKLDATSRTEAVTLATRRGLLSL